MPAGASDTDLANAAFIAIGEVRIANIDSGTSEPARLAKLRLPYVRRSLLRSYLWNAATRRAALSAALANAPPFEFANAFALPEGFLRVVEVMEGDVTIVRFRVERHDDGAVGGTKLAIVTDAASVNLRYIADITPDQMDDNLFEAVAFALAYDLSYGLNKSNTVREAVKVRFTETLANATFVDSTEQSSDAFFLDGWEQARLTDTSEPLFDNTFRFMT